jgi:hypothetical protein
MSDVGIAADPGSVSPSPATSQPAPSTSQPERRTIPDGDYDRLGQAEQGRYVRQRNEANESVWVARDDQPRPGGNVRIEGDIIRIDGLETNASELRDWLRQKSEWDLSRASLPASEAAYEPKLPADFRLPEGRQFQINPSDPALADLRHLAHQEKWPQGTFEKVLAVHAARELKQAQALEAARAHQVELLGTNGPSRVTAVVDWLRGTLGDDHARALGAGIATAKAVAAWEKIINRMVGQNVGTYSRAHSEPPPSTASPSDEDWGRMSAAERYAFARQHDQSRFK